MRLHQLVDATNIPAVKEAVGLMYRGYPCTKDCGGHKAGYAWAKRRGMQGDMGRAGECVGQGGPHNSFWEGCISCCEDRPE